jgi:methylenetetrahydrofolate dehydrogenase (NADP+)/methenyltetrahydrofolate cyclohydrolase
LAANVINGEQVARNLRATVKEKVASLKKEKNRTPGLAIIVVKNPQARVHVARLKERTCRQLGINCQVFYLSDTTTDEEIQFLIKKLNTSSEIHGINIHPLPLHLNHTLISQLVDPCKDVEGLHFLNMGRFLMGDTYMVPFVAGGIVKLIESTGENLEGKKVVVVGRSQLVGKPIAFLLLQKNATVSICHSQTPNLAHFTKRADILVAAAGHPRTITKKMVKEGAIVIDVGINRIGTRLIGDVDKDVEQVAGWITPVPGGVGPVTIAMLLDNLVRAAQKT